LCLINLFKSSFFLVKSPLTKAYSADQSAHYLSLAAKVAEVDSKLAVVSSNDLLSDSSSLVRASI